MNCLQCGALVPDDNRFCEECGAATASATASVAPAGCPKCGAPLDQADEDGFCSACGFRIEPRARDRMERAISANFAGITDRGLRHHRNEDAMGLEMIAETGTAVLIVCDGVSSTQDADRASEVAADAALRSLLGAAIKGRDTHEVSIDAAIAAAQKGVAALGAGLSSPATTIVCAMVRGNVATVGWVGDSRAYWIAGHDANQLTIDHSWLADTIASGEMDAETAALSPNAHAITRWLGADAPQDVPVPIVRIEMPGPGHLLLCTDGLWNYAPEPAAISALLTEADALTTVRGMVEFANARGGHDNITAILLSIEQANVTIQS